MAKIVIVTKSNCARTTDRKYFLSGNAWKRIASISASAIGCRECDDGGIET